MTSVVLTTDASKRVSCDGMDITLSIACEGVSMQASLHRLQESADQLMTAFARAGIDPASFGLEQFDSSTMPQAQKQCARLNMIARGALDLDKLRAVWQIITSMPFPIETELRFFVQDENSVFAALEKEALERAKARALETAALLGLDNAECSSIRFERSLTSVSTTDGLDAYLASAAADNSTSVQDDELTIDSMSWLQAPARMMKIEAASEWNFC